MVAWVRATHDEETELAALAVFEHTALALKLLADLDCARQSGNPAKVAKSIAGLIVCSISGASKEALGEVVHVPRRRLAGRHVRPVKVRCG